MRHREEKRDENKEGATKSFHSFSPPRYSRGHEKFISRTCPLYPPLFLSLSLSSPLTCYQLPARYLRVDVSKNSFNEEFEDEEEEDGKRLARDCSTLFPFRLMRFIYIMEHFVSLLFFSDDSFIRMQSF